DTRTCENERHFRPAIPERVLPGDPLLAEMPAVVAPDDDDRVLREPALLQRIEDAPDLRVDEAGAGEVAADEVPPLSVLLDPFQARFGQAPVEMPGEAGRVVAIVPPDGRQDAIVVGIEV